MDPKKDAENYYEEGRSAKRAQRFKAAIIYFTRAIKLEKNNGDYFFEEALSYAKQGDYKKASRIYKKTTIINPGDRLAYFNCGSALQALGKHDESIKMYQQALRLKYEDAGAHYNLAIILTTKEEYEEARFHYTETLRLDTSMNFKVHNCLGYLYFLQGKFAEATLEFQKAIHFKKKYFWAYCNLSLVLFCENRNQEAEDVFDEGLKVLEEDQNKTEVIQDIKGIYSSEITRLEKKLNGNEEIIAEEKIRLLETLVNGLVKMIDLFAQQRSPQGEKRFLFILSYVSEEVEDLYS